MRFNFMKTTIYIGADHAGFALKEKLQTFLQENYQVLDMGNDQLDAKDDYPDFALAVAKKVSGDPEAFGILLCSSGQGMCMVANKLAGIRAAMGFNKEAAMASRIDENSNVLCLPAKFLKADEAQKIVANWLATPFIEEERHRRRLNKMQQIENGPFVTE